MEALRARELVSQQDRDQARMAVDSLRARIDAGQRTGERR